jgi:hypothetical protein
MSLAISGDTFAYIMGLGLTPDQAKGLIDRLRADALAMTPPATSSGINEEREHIRNASTYAERKRKKDRERQRRLREEARQSRDVAAMSRDVADDPPATEGDTPATTSDASRTRSARVVTPFSSSLRSEEVGGGGGERASEPADDWPDGKATDHVRLLVAQVASPRLDPSKSPGLVTTAGRLVAWRKEGASWEHDVVPVVTALCAKQRSPVSTWKFFDQAIGRSIADNRAALEIPDARVVRLHATGPPSFADTFAAERAEARRKALEDG